MRFEHYQKFVVAGVSLKADTDRERNGLGGMGLAGEAGEVCDHLKKFCYHGVDIDKDKLLKELGDVLWYFALVLHTNNITLEEVMEKNVFKLCDRYPRLHGDPEDVIEGKAV